MVLGLQNVLPVLHHVDAERLTLVDLRYLLSSGVELHGPQTKNAEPKP